jgi:hypothetical protein
MRLDPGREIPPTGQTVGDFWAWAFSDVLSNINRADLAEWLVGSALDCVGGIRPIWAPWDLEYRGSRIEVKSTSYHQNWKRSPNSRGDFDIKATTADFPRDPAIPFGPEAEYFTDPEIKRRAEIYVFAYYAEEDPAGVNPLDVDGWCFYVLPTPELEAHFGTQKKVALSRIRAVTKEIGYENLKTGVDAVVGKVRPPYS